MAVCAAIYCRQPAVAGSDLCAQHERLAPFSGGVAKKDAPRATHWCETCGNPIRQTANGWRHLKASFGGKHDIEVGRRIR